VEELLNVMGHIRVGDLRFGEEEKAAIRTILDSGRISEGPRVAEFEKEWAQYIGTKYCVLTSSGTAALLTGLFALKHQYHLPSGTKVITSPLTFIADANAIKLAGFDPVFVDIDPEGFNITPEGVERYLRENPSDGLKILLPVDLMGYPIDACGFARLSQEYNLLFFQDASEAHGSLSGGFRAGSKALLAAYSFYIAHNIQAGELGALVTDDYDLHLLFRKIKAHGRVCRCPVCTRSRGVCPPLDSYEGEDDFDPRFTHDLIGFNFKAMEFQAALASLQMKKIDWNIKKRQENVLFLNTRLASHSDVIKLPPFSPMVSYMAYPLVIERPDTISRRDLRKALEEEGVETRPLFGCIPTQQPAYAYLQEEYRGKLPRAEQVGQQGFYIGCHQYLTAEDLGGIVSAFDKVLGDITSISSFAPPVVPEASVPVPHAFPNKNNMKVLVTGGGGYVGSILVGSLLDAGYRVRVSDMLLYGDKSLSAYQKHPRFELLVGDLREADFVKQSVEGMDAIVHLAAVVGAPESARIPRITWQVNYGATVSLVRAAVSYGLPRFIFASTGSNYGSSPTETLVTEESALNPLSPYADTKVAAEKYILAHTSPSFHPVVCRLMTVFGVSPRMRFDLLVNMFVRDAFCNKRIKVIGHTWRSYLHVKDVARAIALLLEAPANSVSGQIFNVGSEKLNYKKLDLARLVADKVPGTQVEMADGVMDPRDYRVSFEKIREYLGFEPLKTVPEGVEEVLRFLQKQDLDPYEDTYSNFNKYLSLKQV